MNKRTTEKFLHELPFIPDKDGRKERLRVILSLSKEAFSRVRAFTKRNYQGDSWRHEPRLKGIITEALSP